MDKCSLLKLPEEILKYIGGFLGPRDLLASSATCHTLRTAYNDDLIWRKYTDGEISRRLDGIPSLVQPVFTPLQSSTMDPLCQNRLDFRKQSRLLHNLRHRNFVKHCIPFTGYLINERNLLSKRKQEVTFSDEYVFVLTGRGHINKCINIFNIKSVPYLFMALELENHPYQYTCNISYQVIKTKLIVRQNHWIDVYQINFPNKDVPLQQSFQIDDHPFYELSFGHFLLYSCLSLNIVRIWNLDALKQCNDIVPKIVGSNFRVLACSENYVQVLLCIETLQNRAIALFVYNTQAQSYTNFNVSFCFKEDFLGLIEDNFVVVVSNEGNVKCSVQLYHVERSVVVATKENVNFSYFESVSIKNGILFLPSLFSILMLNLTNLQTVRDLKLDIDSPFKIHVNYADFSKLCLFLIIGKMGHSEIWNLDNMKKVGVVQGYCQCYSSFSKLIICGNNTLKVLSYW